VKLDQGLEVEKGLAADHGLFSQVHRVTHGTVDHPGWNFDGSAVILRLDTTPQDGLSVSDIGVKDNHRSVIPWMPRIADLPGFGNMGVELLVCITKSVRIRARAT
jgi:hypothetical protein